MEENKKEETLEDVFEQLDAVMSSLEDSEISLEESFRLYHRGMELLKTCNDKIEKVEKEVLVLDEEGSVHEF